MTPEQAVLLDPLLPPDMNRAFCELVQVPRELGPASLLGKVHVHLRNRRADKAFRVAYLNALHSIVGRAGRVPEIPRNKIGTAMVGDFDCIDANLAEQIEAILRAEKLWKEAKP